MLNQKTQINRVRRKMEKNLDFVVYKKFIIPSKIGINLEGKDKSNIFLKSETSKYACVPIST